MEFLIGVILMVAVVLLLMFSDPDYRQGYRNSKFLDELKEDEDNKDLTRM